MSGNRKSHPGNPSGLRGSGSKQNVGATVRTVTFAMEIARLVRIVCLSLYGKADKDTVTKYVTNLALANWREWDNKVEENANRASED